MTGLTPEQKKQRARDRARSWHWANKERANATSLRWAAKNRQKARERTLRWRAENKDRERINDAKKRANKSPRYLERRRIDEQNRRARVKSSGGELSKGLAALLLHRQEGKCVYCSVGIEAKFNLDHIVAIAVGGKNEDSNIQLLCPTCNRKKHIKSHQEFEKLISSE